MFDLFTREAKGFHSKMRLFYAYDFATHTLDAEAGEKFVGTFDSREDIADKIRILRESNWII